MRLSKRSLIAIPSAIAVVFAAYLIGTKPDHAKPDPVHGVTASANLTPPATSTNPPVFDPDLPLAERRLRLLQMDREEARAWILSELESGTDRVTGNDVELGSDQNLTSWPSHRVFLLDLLFQVDPVLAATKSRELVETSQSPDEWAVALRNVAKADRNGTETVWLQDQATRLLRNESWKEDPSAGYLNAFDVIVHTRHTALTPDLMALADDPDRKALRHAAFLVLDRLVQVSPEAMLPVLASSAAQYQQSALMLSNLMARADVRQENQRAALETYLLDESRTEEELQGFASVFPNANFHISNNLLTESDGIDGVTLAERDRVSLEVLRGWLGDPRFARIHPTLRMAEGRLKRFVEG